MLCQKCTKCKKNKKLSEFNKGRNKNGVKSQCKVCCAAYNREYRKQNKGVAEKYYKENYEKLKEYRQEYYSKNKETILEKQAEYYKENCENIRKRSRNYSENNKEKIKKANRERYQKNRDFYLNKQKAYAKTPAGKASKINYHTKRRAQTGGKISPDDWLEVMKSTEFKCFYCDCKLTDDNRTIDHIVCLNRGGPHEKNNIIPSCRVCNTRKHARPIREWIKLKKLSQDKIDILKKRGLL